MIKMPTLIMCILACTGAGTAIFMFMKEIMQNSASRAPFKISGIIVLLSLAGALTSIIVNFNTPARIFYIFGHKSAPLASSVILIAVLFVFTGFVIIRGINNEKIFKISAYAGILLAVLLPLNLARMFTLITRPGLNGIFTNILFLAAAAGIGYLVVALIMKLHNENSSKYYVTGLYTDIFYLVALTAFTARLALVNDKVLTLDRLIIGDLAPIFWICAVLLAGIAPLLLNRRQQRSISLACRLIGSAGLFYLITLTPMVTKSINNSFM